MNKILIMAVMIFTVSFASAQSKTKQILSLNQSIDSLRLVLSTTRDSLVKDIQQLNITIKGLNANIKEITKEKTTLKNDLTISQNSNNRLSTGLKNAQLDLSVQENEMLFLKKQLDSLNAFIIEQKSNLDSLKESKYKGYKQMKFTGYSEGDQPYILFEDLETGEEQYYDVPLSTGDVKLMIESNETSFGIQANPKHLNKVFYVKLKKETYEAFDGEQLYEKTDWVIIDVVPK